ncbi:MAG: hypothetical protein ACI4M5_01515 [Christensenellales bacterium]
MDRITEKKPIAIVLLAILLISIILSMPIAVADMGPKPQATFDIVGTENLGNFHLIVFYDHGNYNENFVDDEDTSYEILNSYTYPDLDKKLIYKNQSGDLHIVYSYYAPEKYVFMFVSEDYSKAVKTQVIERKYFEGFYTIDLQGISWDECEDVQVVVECEDIQVVGECKTDYKWWYTIVSTLARMLATVAIECLIALIFIRSKKDFAFIAIVNLISNFLLNLILSLIDFFSGYQLFLYCLAYVFFEVVVIIAEAIAYCKKMPHIAKYKLILYAIFANFISYAVGVMVGLPIWAGVFG